MDENLTAETFTPRVGETFRITFPDGVLELTLVEVTPAAEEPARAALDAGLRAPFSIVFRGPSEPILPQQMYPLEHEELGELEIFIVPIGRDEQGVQYEAVFG
jgi:hypothetical protein